MTREQLLEATALEVGRTWTKAWRVELARDGRPTEGGWPGTLPEARVRAGEEADRALSQRSMPKLTHDELGRVARIAYQEARRSWRK